MSLLNKKAGYMGGGAPLVIAFDLSNYDLVNVVGAAPSGIVGVIFENDGTITKTEEGSPVLTVGTWYTGNTPAIDLDDYDIMYDQQNEFSPNQGFSQVNQWLGMGGGGGDAARWGYEPAQLEPPEICEAIIRVRNATTMVEIDTAGLTLTVES